MKKYCLLLIIFMSGIPFFAQNRLDSLNSERTVVYNKYKEHKDTITVNTWVNIFKLNKYLGQIVALDSLISQEIMNSQKNNNDLEVTQSKLESLISEKKDLNRRLSEAESLKDNYSKNNKIIIIAGSISLLLFVIFLVLFVLTLNKLKKNSALLKEDYTNLYNAKFEIEQLQKDQVNLAAKINNREKDFDNELKKAKERFNILSDEKVMLENQMIEIKKTYDREVERRTIAEEKFQEAEGRLQESSESVRTIHPVIPDETLNENLNKLNTELELEKKLRSNIESELKKLLDKLREHYS